MARYKREFWLNARKDDELVLLETIDQLKKQRSFTATLRDGIRLIVDLRSGKLDVLFELFPFVKERLSTLATPTPSGDLEREIADLRRLIIEQGGIVAPPQGYPTMKHATESTAKGGPLQMNVPKIDLPRFDDDDDDQLVIKHDSQASSTAMLNTVFSFL